MSVIATATSLADPETRGEDLEYNYRLATAIAPERCLGCARYHINWPLGRLARLPSPYGSDRNEFAETIDRLIRARAATARPLTVVVVGAADTGVPAMAAHSAFHAGTIRQTEFVVIDACGTPLQLCRDYGARHGLALRTVERDVVTDAGEIPGDLIIVHSLLRFIRADARADCLRRWRRWLKPGGHMIISNTFAPQAGRDVRSPNSEGLRELVLRDAIKLAEPKERFLKRLDQAPPWPVSALTEADLHGLFDQAGLRAKSIDVVRDRDAAHPPATDRGRMIAVFAAE
jgi:hypothetical protein